jgi:hypothetical protein
MSLNGDLFRFSAKVGCLEGYLYERKDADTSTLPNWVGNIEKMYRNLPEKVKGEFLGDYKQVLEKVLQSAEKILERDNEVLGKLKRMIADLSSKGPDE